MKIDVFANQASEKLLGFCDGDVQVQDLRMKNLLAAEGKELAGERSGTVRGFLDLGDADHRGMRRPQPFREEFRVTANYAQQIIEIVSNSAGKTADCFEFLRLTEHVL